MKKIRLKSGSTELELETDDLATDLEVAILALAQFSQRSGDPEGIPKAEILGGVALGTDDAMPEQHMNSYIAKLGANTGRKILQAASLHLSFNDGRETFSREDLFGRAREAREWKGDYANQQATNVARMVKAGELIERSNGIYTVPQKHLDAAKQVLFS